MSNDGLKQALFYEEKNFLDKDVPRNRDVLNGHIYPYPFTPDTNNDVKNFITISIHDYRLVKTQFKSCRIRINFISHVNCVDTDYDFIRFDYVMSELDELFNESHDFGIGKLQFHNMNEIYINPSYVGQYIEFKTYEFN